MSKSPAPKKLNICLVSRHFPVLGRMDGPSHLRPIARGLAALGHRVTVLAGQDPFGRANLDLDGAKVYFLLEKKSQRLRKDHFQDLVKSKFLDLHSTTHFDIIHSIDDSAIKISRFRKNHKVAVAYDSNATSMGELFSIQGFEQETLLSVTRTLAALSYRFLKKYFGHDRELLKSADGMFVSNPRERTVLERYFLYPDDHIYSVPFGAELTDPTELNELDWAKKTGDLKERYKMPADCRVIVTSSDMREIGEVASVLSAFEQVAIKNQSARLLVLGNGPKMKQIERLSLMLALGSRVIFAGEVKPGEISTHIAMADIYISLSARSSGLEPSLIEAMSQKKIVIGSELSPLASIITHSVDGFLVRPADIPDITGLILDVFNSNADSQALNTMRLAAQTKISTLFDPQQMVNATLSAYRLILSKNRSYVRGVETNHE
jgi:1,2-diacylglycerol 3-alpha-glucosyltransferase